MKPGLQPGIEEQMVVTVAGEMTASFGGVEIHPVLSTVTMVYYMEWVSRKIILPYLENGEEGVGGAITLEHMAPAPVGKVVTFTSTVVEVTSNRVICEVKAEHDKSLVGEGTFHQVILPVEKLYQRIQEMK
ncbi:thioesterase family protein [Marininema halotolerans]|uniref:Predicted thioesterase n=1 Tax=Marininema halotolerans TaxID=1155944 RepID=A0A1I6UK26_9BACL|nr:thioesterase family protein [Marininema halotolerans]SFT01704.1 Predicted thioesterase [Marininema halotolerans]